MSEIKPCPFCGNTSIKMVRFMSEAWLTCPNNCGDMRYIDNEEKAIEAWNKRVMPEGYVKLEDVIEILEAEYEHIPFHIIEDLKTLEVKNESR